MPIGALVFQRVTLAGLVVNFAAVPCMARRADGARWSRPRPMRSAPTPLASAAGWVDAPVACAASSKARALVDFAPWLTWRVPSPSLVVVIAYYACLIVAGRALA